MSGWPETSKRYHDKFRQSMVSHKGEILRTSQINEIVRGDPKVAEHDDQFMQPSDHCINHTNKGACKCALTEQAIFKQIHRGVYQVRNIN